MGLYNPTRSKFLAKLVRFTISSPHHAHKVVDFEASVNGADQLETQLDQLDPKKDSIRSSSLDPIAGSGFTLDPIDPKKHYDKPDLSRNEHIIISIS